MKKKTATKAPAGKKPSSKKTGKQEEVVSTEPVETPVEEVAASTELEIPVEDEQLASKTKGGKRNNDKFHFNDFPNALGKGALVREIILQGIRRLPLSSLMKYGSQRTFSRDSASMLKLTRPKSFLLRATGIFSRRSIKYV